MHTFLKINTHSNLCGFSNANELKKNAHIKKYINNHEGQDTKIPYIKAHIKLFKIFFMMSRW